jgi:hypothetical protein
MPLEPGLHSHVQLWKLQHGQPSVKKHQCKECICKNDSLHTKSEQKGVACLLGWLLGSGSVELWLRTGCEEERCEMGMLLLLRRKPCGWWA